MANTHIVLSDGGYRELSRLLYQGGLTSKAFKRVTALLELNKGDTIEAVRNVLVLSYPTVAKLICNYEQNK